MPLLGGGSEFPRSVDIVQHISIGWVTLITHNVYFFGFYVFQSRKKNKFTLPVIVWRYPSKIEEKYLFTLFFFFKIVIGYNSFLSELTFPPCCMSPKKKLLVMYIFF